MLIISCHMFTAIISDFSRACCSVNIGTELAGVTVGETQRRMTPVASNERSFIRCYSKALLAVNSSQTSVATTPRDEIVRPSPPQSQMDRTLHSYRVDQYQLIQ